MNLEPATNNQQPTTTDLLAAGFACGVFVGLVLMILARFAALWLFG